MIQSRTTAEILATGIDQAIMHNAPSDMVARLRGAHAFVSQCADEPRVKAATVNVLVPVGPAEGVVQDE